MLSEQINQEYIQAMKKRDSLRVSTLSFLRAQIKNVMIDRKLEKIEDADVVQVIKKLSGSISRTRIPPVDLIIMRYLLHRVYQRYGLLS